ncbi:hypothetical protein WMF27_33370 [Sorangium sp. So ce281]|uniref:hypothetical protein n=1 Tax=unclassified Sorangium TaxID=2621164 RepID=UPI003F5EAE06
MDLRAWCAALCAATVGLVGCGGDSGTSGTSGSSDGSGSGSGSGQGSGSSGQGGSFGEGVGSGIGSGSGTTGGGGSGAASSGCEHVDVVFALDNSSSMDEEKASMRDVVFPAFAQALLDIDGILDFRAAVMDACPLPATFHTRGAAGECSFQSGKAWMESTSTDLTGEFQCAADLYVDDIECTETNDDEQPVSSIAAALEPPFSDAENAGFLRNDALLVVVAITDEDEQPAPRQTPQQIHDRLIAAKGDAKNVVFLGIGGRRQCEGAYGDAEAARDMQRLVDLFAADGRGFFWDLCEGHLEDGLTSALAAIEEACVEFVPTVN